MSDFNYIILSGFLVFVNYPGSKAFCWKPSDLTSLMSHNVHSLTLTLLSGLISHSTKLNYLYAFRVCVFIFIYIFEYLIAYCLLFMKCCLLASIWKSNYCHLNLFPEKTSSEDITYAFNKVWSFCPRMQPLRAIILHQCYCYRVVYLLDLKFLKFRILLLFPSFPESAFIK